MAWAIRPAPAANKSCVGKTNPKEISAYVKPQLCWDWPESSKDTRKQTTRWMRRPNPGQSNSKRRGAILAGGMNGDYWDNVAMIIFEASSQDEAKTLAKYDCAAKAY
jgi:hypothetical protein